MVEKLVDVDTIQIGTESYMLARRGTSQAWSREYPDEPPWSGGVPSILSEPQESWHLGGLKSRAGIPNSSEYGQNTDTRWPYRLLPGPQVQTIALASSAANPTSFFEALGYLFVCAGQRVFRIDPSDDSVVESAVFISGAVTIMGLRWETDTGLVTVDLPSSSVSELYQVTAIGPPDTWGASGTSLIPYRIAAGTDRLFGVNRDGLLKNVVSGLDPLVYANWSDLVQCGDTKTLVAGLVAYGKTAFVGKPEGLFGVNTEGKGVPLVKRITRDDDNFKGMANVDPYIFLPHSRGLYRFIPGFVESAGLEVETLNESIIRGQWRGFVVDNRWIYGLLTVGSDTYIMTMRDREEGEPGFGPYIQDTLVHLSTVASEAIWISTLWNPPRLFFGHDYNVGYVKLSQGYGAPDVSGSDYRFALSGSRWTRKYNFGDWGDKDIPKVVLAGKNLTANRYCELLYSVDGGAYSNLDIGGVGMKISSDGRKTFYLPRTAKGREVQFRLDYTGDVNTTAGEIQFLEPFAVPQSRKVPAIRVTLHLGSEQLYGPGKEHRDPATQLNDLVALAEDPTAIALNGPWGDDYGWVRNVRILDTIQVGQGKTEFVAEAMLQKREES